MSLFESDPHKLCEQRIDHAFSRDPTVKFMVQKMEEVRRSHVHRALKYVLQALNIVIALPYLHSSKCPMGDFKDMQMTCHAASKDT